MAMGEILIYSMLHSTTKFNNLRLFIKKRNSDEADSKDSILISVYHMIF